MALELPMNAKIKEALSRGLTRADITEHLTKIGVDPVEAMRNYDKFGITVAVNKGLELEDIVQALASRGSGLTEMEIRQEFERVKTQPNLTAFESIAEKVMPAARTGVGQVVGDAARGVTSATLGIPEALVRILPGEQGVGPVEHIVNASRAAQGIDNKHAFETGAEFATGVATLPMAAAGLTAKVPAIGTAGTQLANVLSKGGRVGRATAAIGKAAVAKPTVAEGVGGFAAGVASESLPDDAGLASQIALPLMAGVGTGVATRAVGDLLGDILKKGGSSKALAKVYKNASDTGDLKPLEDLQAVALQRDPVVTARKLGFNEPDSSKRLISIGEELEKTGRQHESVAAITEIRRMEELAKSGYEKLDELIKTANKLPVSDANTIARTGNEILRASKIGDTYIASGSVKKIAKVAANLPNTGRNVQDLQTLDRMISAALKDDKNGPFFEQLKTLRGQIEQTIDSTIQQQVNPKDAATALNIADIRKNYRDYKLLEDSLDSLPKLKQAVTEIGADKFRGLTPVDLFIANGISKNVPPTRLVNGVLGGTDRLSGQQTYDLIKYTTDNAPLDTKLIDKVINATARLEEDEAKRIGNSLVELVMLKGEKLTPVEKAAIITKLESLTRTPDKISLHNALTQIPPKDAQDVLRSTLGNIVAPLPYIGGVSRNLTERKIKNSLDQIIDNFNVTDSFYDLKGELGKAYRDLINQRGTYKQAVIAPSLSSALMASKNKTQKKDK